MLGRATARSITGMRTPFKEVIPTILITISALVGVVLFASASETRWGPWVAWICIAVTGATLVFEVVLTFRGRRLHQQGDDHS